MSAIFGRPLPYRQHLDAARHRTACPLSGAMVHLTGSRNRLGTASVALTAAAAPPMWTDSHWRIHTVDEPQALFFVLVNPRVHYEDLPDLPPDRAAELGPLLQRMESALRALGGVGKVHTHNGRRRGACICGRSSGRRAWCRRAAAALPTADRIVADAARPRRAGRWNAVPGRARNGGAAAPLSRG
jgi:hypothetical protein